jgi:diaminohydroxyphosphoribosylaminopyrimidine deaminase / 5-amino-6-(5-phosphoribosylamino)uracil reductase
MVEEVLCCGYCVCALKIYLKGFFMSANNDISFMKRAIDLAEMGYGLVNPNPVVGAVVVKNGRIIGEGFHEEFGGSHAEVNALSNIKTAAGATMYVTLEPCNHFGKTPPCTDTIIAKKLSRVVIGLKDPNSLVNGSGIKKLQQAGILVESGILEKDIQKQNEIYIKYIRENQPFCALKTAMTLDGKISTFTGESKWISNEHSRRFVHELRHRYAAIMVGVNTVIKDNPELTDRSEHNTKKQPLRIVVDSTGRTPENSKVYDTLTAPTLFAVTRKVSEDFLNLALDKGAEVMVCPEKKDKVDLSYLVTNLGKKGIDSILIEGGSTLNYSAIEEGIVDKVFSFISPKMLGGANAPSPLGGAGIQILDQAITLKIDYIRRFDNDLLIESYIIKN